MATAVQGNDLPIVQAVTVLFAVMTVLINLGVDIVYGLLNPKVRVAPAHRATRPMSIEDLEIPTAVDQGHQDLGFPQVISRRRRAVRWLAADKAATIALIYLVLLHARPRCWRR